jgi:dethiobiotin synthetase
MTTKNRPARLVAIVGTGTDVGKTWVSQSLLSKWKAQGLRVAARKPVQSFDAAAATTDAEQLAAATGENPYAVCAEHRWYSQAMAPPMAADALSRPRIAIDDLLAELTWPAGIDIGLVETAGGVCSPIAHDGYCENFVRALAPDEVLLVADPGLGTINAIKLSIHCLDRMPTRVFLNRFDATNRLHVLNAQWLARMERLDCLKSIDDWV